MSTRSPGDGPHEPTAGETTAGDTSGEDTLGGATSGGAAPDGDTSGGDTPGGSASVRSTTTVRWWLRLQVGLALGGGVVWFVGAVGDSDFFTGLGAGLLIAALTLRLGRRSAERSRAERRGP